jgi:hypothetical protein
MEPMTMEDVLTVLREMYRAASNAWEDGGDSPAAALAAERMDTLRDVARRLGLPSLAGGQP